MHCTCWTWNLALRQQSKFNKDFCAWEILIFHCYKKIKQMRIKFWFVTNQNQTKIFASKTFLFVSHWDYITKMLHSKIISQLLTINVTSDTKYFFKKSWVSCSSYLYFLWISSQQTFGIVQLYSLTKNTFWNVFFELLLPTVSTLFLPFFLLTFILCKMDFYHTCPAFFLSQYFIYC